MISFLGIMWYVTMISMVIISVVSVVVGIKKTTQLPPGAREGLLGSWRVAGAALLMVLTLAGSALWIAATQPGTLGGMAKILLAAVLALGAFVLLWDAWTAIQRVSQYKGKIQLSRATS